MSTQFKNIAIPFDPSSSSRYEGRDSYNLYKFKNLSPLMYCWSRFFQTLLSMSCSKMVSGEWRLDNHSIYKCEGGIAVSGLGDVVLCPDRVYLDGCGHPEKEKSKADLQRVQELISKIVLEWDPMDPLGSMFNSVGAFLNVPVKEVKEAFGKCSSPGMFGGDSLSYFFNHNPFGKFKIDRDYLRYCLTKISGKTDEFVDEKFASEDLGDRLLDELNNEARKHRSYGGFLCASPKKLNNGISFWLNDGTYYGWHTEQEVMDLISWMKSNNRVPSRREDVFVDKKKVEGKTL